MSVLSTIVDLATTGGVGAITGLLGGWLTKREELKALKVKLQFKKDMASINLQEAELEAKQVLALADKNRELAEIEGEIKTDSIEADAFLESIKNQGKNSGIFPVDLIRGIIRPIITLLLLWVTWDIYSNISNIVGGMENIDPKIVEKMYVDTTNKIIFLTTLAVSWWFASRPANITNTK